MRLCGHVCMRMCWHVCVREHSKQMLWFLRDGSCLSCMYVHLHKCMFYTPLVSHTCLNTHKIAHPNTRWHMYAMFLGFVWSVSSDGVWHSISLMWPVSKILTSSSVQIQSPGHFGDIYSIYTYHVYHTRFYNTIFWASCVHGRNCFA